MLRLRSSSDVERVRREGKSYAHPLVVLVACRQPEASATRVAVVAGRSVGVAVKRNRAKRLLREAARTFTFAPGWDLMLIARAPLVAVKLTQARVALGQVFNRAHVIATPATPSA